MKSKNLIIDGLSVHYMDNENNAPVLLFLHGWGCDAQTLSPLFSAFEKDYRIIAPDFPGFGKSTLPKDAWHIADYADFVEGFEKKMDIEIACYITHSFGGRVMLDYASRKEVKKLVLINSGGIKNTSLKVQLLGFVAKTGKLLGFSFLRNWFYKNIVGEEDAINTLGSEILRKIYQNTVNEDLQNRAEHITNPVLLLWGEKDTATPLWHGKRWHELMQTSLFFTHPGDHFFFLQDPNWTVKKIQTFLDS